MTIKDLQREIKDKIIEAGYRYVSAEKWFNFDLGVFPAALVNNGFSVQVIESRASMLEDADTLFVRFKVEFMLDPRHDAYLDRVDDIVSLMRTLSQNAVFNNAEVISDSEWQNFTLTNAGELVALTFNQVQFEI